MSKNWSIEAEWAPLETGPAHERAGFAALGISAYGIWLTTGHDRLSQTVRKAPYLSAYHFAEWLAWNWWRLRWEPRKASPEWELSHAMASIGSGYVWPNIHIVSDGENITLISRPTPERTRTPYRYINDCVSIITAAEFESEVDRFIESVLKRVLDYKEPRSTEQTIKDIQERLLGYPVPENNLQDIWRTVERARRDPAVYALRKLEALLGEDPGEVEESRLAQLLAEGAQTGQAALEEIAANRIPGQDLPDIPRLLELGCTQGAQADSQSRISLHASVGGDLDLPWKIGAAAAILLREQEHIKPESAITNAKLAEMAGASGKIFETPPGSTPPVDLSFLVTESAQHDRIVLRSRWQNGRRFELARLLGDALVHSTDDPMRPATRSDTHRQKVQRAFAAELLSPFQAVDAMLAGDYSLENQQDVAQHFQVSDLTIRSLLVSNKRIDRSELE